MMPAFALYSVAALAEITGCFAFWAWLRLGKSFWWLLPGWGRWRSSLVGTAIILVGPTLNGHGSNRVSCRLLVRCRSL